MKAVEEKAGKMLGEEKKEFLELSASVKKMNRDLAKLRKEEIKQRELKDKLSIVNHFSFSFCLISLEIIFFNKIF